MMACQNISAVRSCRGKNTSFGHQNLANQRLPHATGATDHAYANFGILSPL